MFDLYYISRIPYGAKLITVIMLVYTRFGAMLFIVLYTLLERKARKRMVRNQSSIANLAFFVDHTREFCVPTVGHIRSLIASSLPPSYCDVSTTYNVEEKCKINTSTSSIYLRQNPLL